MAAEGEGQRDVVAAGRRPEVLRAARPEAARLEAARPEAARREAARREAARREAARLEAARQEAAPQPEAPRRSAGEWRVGRCRSASVQRCRRLPETPFRLPARGLSSKPVLNDTACPRSFAAASARRLSAFGLYPDGMRRNLRRSHRRGRRQRVHDRRLQRNRGESRAAHRLDLCHRSVRCARPLRWLPGCHPLRHGSGLHEVRVRRQCLPARARARQALSATISPTNATAPGLRRLREQRRLRRVLRVLVNNTCIPA